jgi:hypothetical protein
MAPTNFCDPSNCKNWDCAAWCKCYEEEKIAAYDANGCEDDGDNSCVCFEGKDVSDDEHRVAKMTAERTTKPLPADFSAENIKFTTADRGQFEYAKSFTSDPKGYLHVDAAGEMTQGSVGTWGFTTDAIEALVGQSINDEWQVTLPFRFKKNGDGYIAIAFNCPTNGWSSSNYGGAFLPDSFLIQRWPTGVPNWQRHGSNGNVWFKAGTSVRPTERGALPSPGDSLFTEAVDRKWVITRTAGQGFKVDLLDASGASMLFAGGLETKEGGKFTIEDGKLPFCFFNNGGVTSFSSIEKTG